jgi:chromosome segregation ATPase
MDGFVFFKSLRQGVSARFKLLLGRIRLNTLKDWEKRTTTQYSRARYREKALRDLLEGKKRTHPELKARIALEKKAYDMAYSKKQFVDAKLKRIEKIAEDVRDDIKSVVSSGQAGLDVSEYVLRLKAGVDSEVASHKKTIEVLSSEAEKLERQIRRLEEEVSKNITHKNTLDTRLNQIEGLRKETNAELEYISGERTKTEGMLEQVMVDKKELEMKLFTALEDERRERLKDIESDKKKLEEKLKALICEDNTQGGGEVK